MSMNSLQKIKTAVEMRPAEIIEEKKKGKIVFGWIGYLIPEEIIHALGMIPLRLGKGGDERLVELGTRYISSQNCAFIRVCAGMFADNTEPYSAAADAIAYDTTCMQIYRLGEVTSYFFKKKSFFLGIPNDPSSPGGQKYFHHELEHFTKKLENFSGNSLTNANLEKSITLYQDIRRYTTELFRHVASEHPLISWGEAHFVIHAGYYLDREQYRVLLQKLVTELENSSPSHESHSQKPRIILSGSPLLPGDNKLIDVIEITNGRVVSDLLWSDRLHVSRPDIQSPTIPGIADAYMQVIPHHSLPCITADEDQRFNHLKEMIAEVNASGVIYHTMRFCDSTTCKVPNLKNRLNDLGIPLLEIHTEYSNSDIEAMRTRVEAFIELLASNSERGVSA